MRWARSWASWAILCWCSIACTQQASAPDAPAPGLSGYNHTFAKSRFNAGDIVSELDQFAMHKIVGSVGTFATEIATDAVVALPNVPFPDPAFGVYPGDADAQNEYTRSYFVAAGLPEDQIASVTADAAGLVGRDGATLQGWWSLLNRGWDGVPIDGSMAMAAFDANGQSSGEQVYWPELPKEVLGQMHTLQELLADPLKKSEYIAKLPASSRDALLVIRHTSWFWTGAFAALACCRGASPIGLCFDASGHPVHLPDEEAPAP